MYLQVFLLIIAVAVLYYGAEFTLESGEKIGRYFGLSPLVIGLLIVGFGTSLPEFFVSQLACIRGESPIALGNIVGSNIANLFLIMGISGLFVTLHILRKEIFDQLIYHIVLTGLLAFALMQKSFTLLSAFSLLIFFSFYLYKTFAEMKKQRHLKAHDPDDEVKELRFLDGVLLVVGFGLLYGGGELLVYSGTELGKSLGISTYVISAVLLAFGTSFPELMTAMLACYKKKNTDLITGNILGSNIFNVAFVMTSIFPYKISYGRDYKVELIILGSAAIFLFTLSALKKNFTRISGILFCSSYIGIVYYWANFK
jgi:cation:H+ antiporter